MNVALILAGGSGRRVGQDIPKQFLNVYNKPILIYTLECFQNHPDVDAIIVSCLSGWEEVVRAYSKEYGINKLKWVVPGGENGQSSARTALLELEKTLTSPNDIIIIHDGVRPYLEEYIITDAINTCKKYGSGLSSIRFNDTIMTTNDRISGSECIDKDYIMRVMTPQAYYYKKALWAHMEALKRNITDAPYTNTLMLNLGEKLYFSKGSAKNIKITTIEDVEIFKSIYSSEREDWVK